MASRRVMPKVSWMLSAMLTKMSEAQRRRAVISGSLPGNQWIETEKASCCPQAFIGSIAHRQVLLHKSRIPGCLKLSEQIKTVDNENKPG